MHFNCICLFICSIYLFCLYFYSWQCWSSIRINNRAFKNINFRKHFLNDVWCCATFPELALHIQAVAASLCGVCVFPSCICGFSLVSSYRQKNVHHVCYLTTLRACLFNGKLNCPKMWGKVWMPVCLINVLWWVGSCSRPGCTLPLTQGESHQLPTTLWGTK